jgi:uncharacterized membrane protein
MITRAVGNNLLPAICLERAILFRKGVNMDNKKRIRYSIQLAMLKQLLNKGMITEEEYRRILVKLKKDYSVVSDVNT